MFCDDETPSYQVGYFRAAAITFANWSEGLVRGNSSGASVYVQWIKDNSYADDATYLSFVVPAIGPEPIPPGALPTVPALERNEKETATAETAKLGSQYQSALANWQGSITAATKAVKQETSLIRTMPDRRIGPSDIWGCPQFASERFSEVPHDMKVLVIASDMDMVGPQEKADVTLNGVVVDVIDFETSDVGSYGARTQYWSQHLKQAGAASVTFYRQNDILPTELF